MSDNVLGQVTAAVERTLKARHGPAVRLATEIMELARSAIGIMNEAKDIPPRAAGMMTRVLLLAGKFSKTYPSAKAKSATMTADEFESYVVEQISKVATDAQEVAANRLSALQESIELAKQSFADGVDRAEVRVFDESGETSIDIDPKNADKAEATGFAGNPEDVGKAIADLQKSIEALSKSFAEKVDGEGDAAGEGSAVAGADAAGEDSGEADAAASGEGGDKSEADAAGADGAEAAATAKGKDGGDAGATDGEDKGSDVEKGAETHWPMDLNTKDFREGVHKAEKEAGTWGMDGETPPTA